MTPVFQDEARFVRYSDSSRSGPMVTFALPDRDMLQAFVGLEGKRLAMALVILNDDETLAEAPKPRTVEKPAARWLALRCKDLGFQHWMQVDTEEEATAKVRAQLGVQSRGDVDGDPEAMKKFDRLRSEWSRYATSKVCRPEQLEGTMYTHHALDRIDPPATPGDGAWVNYAGGGCPVDEQTFVCVRLRGGESFSAAMPAGEYFWENQGDDGDIVAYRIVGEQHA